ncbi:MAG TPA: hypothetical protein VK533_07765 [Sphingomonas sp.]|uniref:hypothetical protein n=1 Tax=Sphingomonas sp. TaxID=28214 RepID=UPI002BEF4D70|nr:hypothetical protein [Sphingomonas sp.]HMI19424.1 hypothetical protein [Sphingomonas sp.]
MAFNGRPQNANFGNHSWLMNQLVAAGQGALDDFTFGLDDQAYAGARALIDAANGKSLSQAYRDRIAYEHARDQYYAQHYGVARTAGKIAGSVAQLAVGGGLGTIGKAGARIKQVTPMIGRELAALGGVGATGGVGGQAYSDAMRGRLSSLGDYAGAGLGGAAEGVMATRGQPGKASAAGGFVTSLAQDVLNGRRPSMMKAIENASAASLLGAAGGAVGRKVSERLPSQLPSLKGPLPVGYRPPLSKEILGESGSRARTWARGDKTVSANKERLYLDQGGFTRPDQRTLRGQHVESKYGIHADLTPRQKQAYRQLSLDYRVDQALPGDLGFLHGFFTGQAGYQMQDDWARKELDL